MAVDGEGRVLVADDGNDRLLVMDQSLSSAHEMSVSLHLFKGLKGPHSLWYDQSCRRLCVAEKESGRVIVVDNLEDFSASRV